MDRLTLTESLSFFHQLAR